MKMNKTLGHNGYLCLLECTSNTYYYIERRNRNKITKVTKNFCFLLSFCAAFLTLFYDFNCWRTMTNRRRCNYIFSWFFCIDNDNEQEKIRIRIIVFYIFIFSILSYICVNRFLLFLVKYCEDLLRNVNVWSTYVYVE